ncbi:MAG: L,D-transpeptidase [Pseudomonadota bacterium]
MSLMRLIFSLAAAVCVLIAAGQPAEAARRLVSFNLNYPMGAIVIINSERKLYYVLGNGRAIQYPVSIGNQEEIWTGMEVVTEKKENPKWTDPENPDNVVQGGPHNPLGVRAIYLGWTLWRIHGTPQSWSIGRAVSNGCIRMYNKDVVDLYDRVHVGAPVYVIKSRYQPKPTAHGGAKLNPAPKVAKKPRRRTQGSWRRTSGRRW